MINKIFIFLLMLVSNAAFAQRNVEYVIPFTPGGAGDQVALILSGALREELAAHNINPVLTHRPGGGGALAASSVAQSDKLQILQATNAIVTVPVINPSAANYKIDTDFVPLAYVGYTPMLLVVNSNNKISTIQDFQRECKRRPISYGSAGIGSVTHIASSMVMDALGCSSVHVPYKGLPQALTDLKGAHVDMVVGLLPAVRPHIDSQALRPLLSVDRNRITDFNTLPSMTDLGKTDYNFYTWITLMVNSSASEKEIEQVRVAVQKSLSRADVRKRLHDIGLRDINQPIPRTFLSQESQRFKKILDTTKIDAK